LIHRDDTKAARRQNTRGADELHGENPRQSLAADHHPFTVIPPPCSSLRSVASGGKIIQIGVLTGFGPKPDLARLQWENADIIGITVGSGEHFAAMNRFLTDNARA
jgi:D-arabinose 1-dehydrogenase-like Zn-dependent alcohol dehydrogenase